MDASIKTIRYVDTIDVEEETPLGETIVRSVVVDSFVVAIDVGTLVDHELYFRPEAVANRMAVYGLTTQEEAIEALVRELVFRWSPSLAPSPSVNVAQLDPPAVIEAAAAFGFVVPDTAADVVPVEGEEGETELVTRPATDEEKAAALRPRLQERVARVAANGGVDERIAVAWTAAAESSRSGALGEQTDRIAEALAVFSPAPPSPGDVLIDVP